MVTHFALTTNIDFNLLTCICTFVYTKNLSFEQCILRERKKASDKTFDEFKHNPSFLNKPFIHNLADHSAKLFFLNSHIFWMQLSNNNAT